MYGVLLHEWNAALAFTMLSSLQFLELSVRNHINVALTEKYNNVSWWGEVKNGILVPSNLIVGDQKYSVSKAITVSGRRARGVTPGGVISELSFGFWLALLGPSYNNTKIEPTFWSNTLDKVFNKRGFVKREVVFKELENIVRLRNKCAHHDSIVDLDINAEYNEIVSFSRRFSKTTADWIANTSLIPHLLQPNWISALKVSGRLIGLP